MQIYKLDLPSPDAYAAPGKPIRIQPLKSAACAEIAVTQLPRLRPPMMYSP